MTNQYGHEPGIGAPAQDADDDDKAVSSLIARFALRGHAVHRLADGGFLVCRWGMSRPCPDVRALAAFARAVGVAE